jgi:cytochrome P450
VSRQVTVDTVLLGHKIPKGVILLINSSGPGYLSSAIEIPESIRSETSRSKYWGGVWNPDDVHLFRPERWLKTNDKGEVTFDPRAGPFMSFSLGPRGCFGKRLAYLEMRIVLALLIWSFQFEKLDDDLSKYDTVESVTIMPKTCYVKLRRLEQ